jgi:uncharacterized RDD family membrane protein YckC
VSGSWTPDESTRRDGPVYETDTSADGAGFGYRVETPEQIGLDYDVAGLGTRFQAALIDTIILAVTITLIICLGTFGLALSLDAVADGETAAIWAFAIIILLIFAVFWGYYVVFETVWQGQSPGKRWTGLRVIREGGYPIGFSQAALRNIVRIADFLPFSYAIGATVMLFDKQSRRLGDFVAGTIVIKEARDVTIESLGASGGPLPAAAMAGWPSSFGQPQADPVRIPNLNRLTSDDQALLREYFARRRSLSPQASQALALRLATAFATKLDYSPTGDVPDVFLTRIARQLAEPPGTLPPTEPPPRPEW